MMKNQPFTPLINKMVLPLELNLIKKELIHLHRENTLAAARLYRVARKVASKQETKAINYNE
jgi:hypothetical protein